MPDGYSSHRDYFDKIEPDAANRQLIVEIALRESFADFIEQRKVEVVLFSSMSVFDLAQAIERRPLILKSLLACCNLAGRAIERDLGIKNVDTYEPKFKEGHAAAIAGYIKPFLPPYLELPVLAHVDRISYIDKEIRKNKGNWEKRILLAVNRYAQPRTFQKSQFVCDGDAYEIDVAYTDNHEMISIAIDVKRIEARRDIHKRADEIVNKARKLHKLNPKARFGAVIYYPFFEEHANVQNRLRSTDIHGIVFASDSDESIDNAVQLLLSMLKIKRKSRS